jgi:hypothetical protein
VPAIRRIRLTIEPNSTRGENEPLNGLRITRKLYHVRVVPRIILAASLFIILTLTPKKKKLVLRLVIGQSHVYNVRLLNVFRYVPTAISSYIGKNVKLPSAPGWNRTNIAFSAGVLQTLGLTTCPSDAI